jgi:hypothetical protein
MPIWPAVVTLGVGAMHGVWRPRLESKYAGFATPAAEGKFCAMEG